MKQLAVTLLVALILLTNTAAANSNGYEISPWVIGGGGGHSGTNPYTLDGTVGQATAGPFILHGPYDECAGFWCWGWSFERKSVYLPVVLRNW